MTTNAGLPTTDRSRECECGDYDTDHEDGTGYCHFNVPPKNQPLRTTDICHGQQNCLGFRRVGESKAKQEVLDDHR